MSAPRVSLEPLIAAVGGMGELVRMLDAGNAYRARREGLSELQADRWATRCGLHAYEVWPELLEAAVADVERECADPKCPGRFVPSARARGGKHLYCSPRCQRRHASERRRSTPEGAAKNRERRRRYYELNGDYERARERRKSAANRSKTVS